MRANRLESLISIRICSRDPGQNILLKQRLIGIGGDLFAFGGKLAMAPTKCFSVVTVFYFSFWASLLTVFKSFLPFGSFLTLKINNPTHPSSLANFEDDKNRMAERRYLLAFVCCHAHCSFCRRLFANGFNNKDPHFLWKQPHPPLIISAPAGGLRKCTERSY